MRVGIAAVGRTTAGIAAGHVTTTAPIGVVRSTEGRVVVHSTMKRRGTTTR